MNQVFEDSISKIEIEFLLGKLQPWEKDVMTWWYLEGYTWAEVAELYNQKYAKLEKKAIGGRTIGVRIQKILKKLRKYAGESDLPIESKPRRRKNGLARNTKV